MNLETVYETYFPKIYNYIFYRVMHKQTAEDLTSAVFLKAADRFHTYDSDKGAVSTWLFKIAENTLTDHFRANRIAISADELTDSTALSVDFEEQTAIIKDENLRELYIAMQQLGDVTRGIISEKYFAEKSIKQIAKERNMNESTVSTMHSRGLEKLRKIMKTGGMDNAG